MAENFREFNPGNGSGNEGNNTRNKTSRKGSRSYGKIVASIVGLLIFAVLALESVYSIGEQEQGVVTTFGHAGSVVTSGLHFKIPFVQRVTKVNTTILGFPIGYRSGGDDSASQEQIDDESLMITSDFNFVNVDFYVEYKVSDPVKYLYNSRQPKEILKNIAQSCIRNIISNYIVDDVITTGKSKIQAEIKEMIIEKLEEQDIGLMLVNISMQDAEPPTEDVIEAFKAVETAKQGKETAINNANKYRNEKLPEASAKADQITQEAEAAKQARVNEGIAQAARFNEMYAEYEKNPLLTKQRMFYEAMEEVLPGVKLIIDDGSGDLNKTLYLDELQLEDITGNKSEASSSEANTQEGQ
ncbi:MAG: FtsH protease activity modulator HflK [Lachnospiraceae bacterium]|nr:FtsH protease activity modulator HflK [Lachnospiraceae bacterium]